MGFDDIFRDPLPDYEWASTELKDETRLRAHHFLEKAFQESLIRGRSEMVNHREGTRWVGDNPDHDEARFIFSIVLDKPQLGFRELSQCRELEEFDAGKDSIKFREGDMVIEFKSETFEAHHLSPEELATQEDVPVEEVEPADGS